MVALEEPLALQDMLIRFTGIDVLQAAGPSAQIPSKLSGQQEAILGVTHPNGTTLKQPEAIELEPLDEEEVQAQQDAKDESREAYYGPRRSATLTLVLVTVIILVVLFIRWVSQKRRYSSRGVQLDFAEPKKRRSSHHRPQKEKKKLRFQDDDKNVELENLIRGDDEV
jgi:hypothetical protein